MFYLIYKITNKLNGKIKREELSKYLSQGYTTGRK